MAQNQKINLEKFIKEIQDDYLKVPLMTFVPLNNLKRLIDSPSYEEMKLAYGNKFVNTVEISKEFSSIINTIDYLYLEFSLIPDHVRRALENDSERKSILQKLFLKSLNILGLYMLKKEFNNLDATDSQIQDIMDEFRRTHISNFDLKFYYENYFIPINNLMVTFLERGIRYNEFITVAQLTREGKQLFELIEAENKLLKESIKKILAKVDQNISELIIYTHKILD